MKEKEDINSNGHDETAAVKLVEALYNTPPEKLVEMTDIPLDQIRPLSMMTIFAQETDLLCDDIIKAQRWWSDNWKKYHPRDTVVDVDTDEEYDTDKLKLLVPGWMASYYKHRRSKGGEHRMGAVTLAQDQIAAQQQDGMSMEAFEERLKPQ